MCVCVRACCRGMSVSCLGKNSVSILDYTIYEDKFWGLGFTYGGYPPKP